MVQRIPELSAKDKARFWAKVDVRDLNECWPWTAGFLNVGYGKMSVRGVQCLSHRVALTLEIGQSEDAAMYCLHSCDNKACCNPLHLRWGTQKENGEDASKRGRSAYGSRNGSHTMPERTVRGIAVGSAKLDDETVRYIRSSPLQGRELAKLFGVCEACMSAVRNYKTWKHVL